MSIPDKNWLRRLRVMVEDMRNPCFGSEIHNQTVREVENMLLCHVDEILSAPSARAAILEEAAKVCENKANKPKDQTTEYAQFMLRTAAFEIRDLIRAPTDGGTDK